MNRYLFDRARRRAILWLIESFAPAAAWGLCAAVAGAPPTAAAIVALLPASFACALAPQVTGRRLSSRLAEAAWRPLLLAAWMLGMEWFLHGGLSRQALAWAPLVLLGLGSSRLLLMRGVPPSLVLTGPAEACIRWERWIRGSQGERPALVVRPWAASVPEEPELAILADEASTAYPDWILVCGDAAGCAAVTAALRPVPVPVAAVPELFAGSMFEPGFERLCGLPVLRLVGAPISEGALAAKWIEDKVIGGLILIAISPVLAAVAFAIRVSSAGPVLFVQERHGLNGRTVRVLKFRTMRHATSGSSTPAGERSGSDFRQAVAGDPRITPLGRFLRNTSLDELPQFINVLTGEMSIVGPRPHPIKLNQQFLQSIPDLMRRHFVKPGITGLAQIGGARGETRTSDDMKRRVDLDLLYLRTASLAGDFRIILTTVIKGFYNHHP